MMPTTKENLVRLVSIRLSEARLLLAAGHAHGAYYFAGYAVECAIKAVIASRTVRGEFPDKKKAQGCFSHEFKELLKWTGLEGEIAQRIAESSKFAEAWAAVKGWVVDCRYDDNITIEAAQQLVEAASHPEYGVVQWFLNSLPEN